MNPALSRPLPSPFTSPFLLALLPLQAIKFSKNFGSTTAIFNSPADCNKAFDMMQGTPMEVRACFHFSTRCCLGDIKSTLSMMQGS